MSRIGSLLLATGVAGVLVLAVLWGGSTEGRSPAGLLAAAPETPAVGDVVLAARPLGADSALRDCIVCHSVDPADASRAAPDLHGIVGAEKAGSPWFNYSKALRSADGIWSEAELDKYLTHPTTFLPGTKKTIAGIADAQKRREIIDALKATSGN